MSNIIIFTDAYKTSHNKQYPPKTTEIYSYLSSRGGRFDEVALVGLQAILLKHFTGKVITKEKIDEAEELINGVMGPGVFNRVGWEYILNKHDGKLPLEIKAVPEGRFITVKNVLLTIRNTDPEC